VDGHTLLRVPFGPDAPQISAHIPFMVGTNHDESRALIGENNQALFQSHLGEPEEEPGGRIREDGQRIE